MIQTVRRAARLNGTVELPGDKSISHRYAMLAALAEGGSVLRHYAGSRDCRSTLGCFRSMGIEVQEQGGAVKVEGRGLLGLRQAYGPLDAGNSGTTIRLLSGILSGQSFETEIGGDESLSRRPMGRIMDPLRRMGAVIESREGNLPPLRIRGGQLRSLRYELPVASAQVKSCVLLAGLFADGVTAVRETVPTRDHTEIALREFGAEVRHSGEWIEVLPGPRLTGREVAVPGDLSGGAFFLVAAAIVPGSDIRFPDVGLNPRRRELLDYLVEAGVDLTVERESVSAGEARGDVRVRFADGLAGRELPPVSGDRVAALIDEVPALAILGSQAGGLTVSGATELRVKESDRIAAIVSNLRAMGAEVEERPDGFTVEGGRRLRGAEIETAADHRIAMSFGVAGLVADGETRIHEAESADVSFPGFWETLESVRS
jgi:3-phosphoshikimate 1-carboxyvinyltransferase